MCEIIFAESQVQNVYEMNAKKVRKATSKIRDDILKL